MTAPVEAKSALGDIWAEVESEARTAAKRVQRTWHGAAEFDDLMGEIALMLFEKQERYLSARKRPFLTHNLVKDLNRLVGDQLVGRDGKGGELTYGVTPERQDMEGNFTGVPLGEYLHAHAPGERPEPHDVARFQRVEQIKREFPLAWAHYAEGIKVRRLAKDLKMPIRTVQAKLADERRRLAAAGFDWLADCVRPSMAAPGSGRLRWPDREDEEDRPVSHSHGWAGHVVDEGIWRYPRSCTTRRTFRPAAADRPLRAWHAGHYHAEGM